MNTLLLGRLVAPSKHRKYIEYIQKLQSDGLVYQKDIVDNLIERFIEVVDDNYHIRETCIKKKSLPNSNLLDNKKINAMIVSMQKNAHTLKAVSTANCDVDESVENPNNESYILDIEEALHSNSQIAAYNSNGTEAYSFHLASKEEDMVLVSTKKNSCFDSNEAFEEKHKEPAPLPSINNTYCANGLNEDSCKEEKSEEPSAERQSVCTLIENTYGGKHLASSRIIKTPHNPKEICLAPSKTHPKYKQLLKIKEEFSEISAYAISVLLISAKIEDLLYGENIK